MQAQALANSRAGARHLLSFQPTPVLALPIFCCTGAAAIEGGGALSPDVSTAPTTLPTAGVRYRIQLVGRSNCPDQSERKGERASPTASWRPA